MAMRIYIGQKLGTVDRIRKQVDTHVPRSAGQVTFYRDGMIVETINTTNMREIVHERVCRWMPVHLFARLDYADQVEIRAGIEGAMQQRQQNEAYNSF